MFDIRDLALAMYGWLPDAHTVSERQVTLCASQSGYLPYVRYTPL